MSYWRQAVPGVIHGDFHADLQIESLIRPIGEYRNEWF